MAAAIVLFGVSGCGKTTIGKELSKQLCWEFLDADDYHNQSSIEKMKNSIPLTDEDRESWLKCLTELLSINLTEGKSVVLACSALKETYRWTLGEAGNVVFLHLRGDHELIENRLKERRHRYMPSALLVSQFECLELTGDYLEVDIRHSVAVVVEMIVKKVKPV